MPLIVWITALFASCVAPQAAAENPPETPSAPSAPSAPAADTLAAAFPPPAGAIRAEADAFGAWLRARPLRPAGSPVRSYRGDVLNMPAARVFELPIGTADLQQCADSALRLRATWEREAGFSPAFHYTSGYLSRWSDWAAGGRPRVSGSTVTLRRGAAPSDASEASFEAWLMNLFMYAGTRSLGLDTTPVTAPQVGDVLVLPGSPGHAVLILDVATHEAQTWVLVGQGFMPAMDFHVVAGPVGGWYPVEGDTLPTEPIVMPWSGLRRWKTPEGGDSTHR